jgi:hypothetical protein
MKNLAVPFVLAAALAASACAQLEAYDPYVDAVTVPFGGRMVASVSQDAGLSLAAGAAPGTENGFFYDWRRRDTEQRIQAAQREERYEQRQAGVVP